MEGNSRSFGCVEAPIHTRASVVEKSYIMELHCIRLDQKLKQNLQGSQRRLDRDYAARVDEIHKDRKSTRTYFEQEKHKLQLRLGRLSAAKYGTSCLTDKAYIRQALQHRGIERLSSAIEVPSSGKDNFARQRSLPVHGGFAPRRVWRAPKIRVTPSEPDPESRDKELAREPDTTFLTHIWSSCLDIPTWQNELDELKIPSSPRPPQRAQSFEDLLTFGDFELDRDALESSRRNEEDHTLEGTDLKRALLSPDSKAVLVKAKPHLEKPRGNSAPKSRSITRPRSASPGDVHRGPAPLATQAEPEGREVSGADDNMNDWTKSVKPRSFVPSPKQKRKSRIDLEIPTPNSPRLNCRTDKKSSPGGQREQQRSHGEGVESSTSDKKSRDSRLLMRKVRTEKRSVVLPARCQSPSGALCAALGRSMSASPRRRRAVSYEECVVEPDSLGPAEIEIGRNLPDAFQIEDSPMFLGRIDFIGRALSPSPTPHSPKLLTSRNSSASPIRPRSATIGSSRDLAIKNGETLTIGVDMGSGSLRGSQESIRSLSPNILSKSPRSGTAYGNKGQNVFFGESSGRLPSMDLNVGLTGSRPSSPAVHVQFIK